MDYGFVIIHPVNSDIFSSSNWEIYSKNNNKDDTENIENAIIQFCAEHKLFSKDKFEYGLNEYPQFKQKFIDAMKEAGMI